VKAKKKLFSLENRKFRKENEGSRANNVKFPPLKVENWE
jgi:hypothetical protein